MDCNVSDDDLASLLILWGVSVEIIAKFIDEEVTVDTLLSMSEQSLQMFFPKAGPRTRFLTLLTEYKINNRVQKERSSTSPKASVTISSKESGESPHPSSKVTKEPGESPLPSSQVTTKRSTVTESIDAPPTKQSKPTEPDVLDKLLNSTPDGKIILTKWAANKKFTSLDRNKLGDEIVRDLMRMDVESSFPDSKIEYWAKVIVEKFPGEIDVVWAGSGGQHRSTAAGRGVLLSRYYAMRRKLVKAGVIRKSAVTGDPLSDNDDELADTEEDQGTAEIILWLQHNSRAVAPVLEKWKRTSLTRVRALKASKSSVDKYFDDYAVLRLSDAFTLIEADFEVHYPQAAMKLFTEWIVLSSFLLDKVTIAEKDSVEDSFTSDGKKAKTLRLLHSLFPVKSVPIKGKKIWRPNRLEGRNGLLQYAKTTGEIQTVLADKRAKYKELGIPFPPQVVLVSLDEDTIESSHVAIHNVIYNVDNPLKAFDVAFKAAHMLDVHYARECSREMVFLQVAVYGFSTPFDKKALDKQTLARIEEYKAYKTK